MSKNPPSAYAFISALKQEEAEHIHELVSQYRTDMTGDQADDPARVFRHQHAGRDMTHWEVHLDAVAEIMLLVDERIGVLHHRNEE